MLLALVTDTNSVASTNVFQQAYNSYQDSEQPKVMLQSFPAQPTEWIEDDLDKEILGIYDEDNLSPRSSPNALQQAYNFFQYIEQPRVILEFFLNQPQEWTQDDLFKEIERVKEGILSPHSLSNVHEQELQDCFQDTKQPQVTSHGSLNQLMEWSEDDFQRKIMQPLKEGVIIAT
nr:hypothetical protein [Tanacetum cinerariifolium]